MEKEIRTEQHYAVSVSGRLVHINEAHCCAEDFYCPHCGCRMMKKCGSIRAWHFAHDWHNADEFQKKCSYETYLHGCAKYKLKQWFYESESIIFHIPRVYVCKAFDNCMMVEEKNKCIRKEHQSYDLKKLFDRCEIEVSTKEINGDYRADLLLMSTQKPENHVLVEIKVFHGCTEKKKASNARIIEFDVNSEDDIEYIVSHDIEESDKVRYYGFRNTEEDNFNPISLNKFRLYKSGKPRIVRCNCKTILERHRSSLLEITANMSEADGTYLNLYGLIKARDLKISVSNCFLCEHCIYSPEAECNMCKIKNAKIDKGADALECNSYEVSLARCEKLKNKAMPFTILDMWTANNIAPHRSAPPTDTVL